MIGRGQTNDVDHHGGRIVVTARSNRGVGEHFGGRLGAGVFAQNCGYFGAGQNPVNAIAGQQQPVMFGQFDIGMIEPEFGFDPQGPNQHMAQVRFRANMIGGQAHQPPVGKAPRPAIANMDQMRAAAAQREGSEGRCAVLHRCAARLRVQPAIVSGQRQLHRARRTPGVGQGIEPLDQRAHRQFGRGSAGFAAADPIGHRGDDPMARAFQRSAHVNPAEILIFRARTHAAGKARCRHQFIRIAHSSPRSSRPGASPVRARIGFQSVSSSAGRTQ